MSMSWHVVMARFTGMHMDGFRSITLLLVTLAISKRVGMCFFIVLMGWFKLQLRIMMAIKMQAA